jgi:hypothetical protein
MNGTLGVHLAMPVIPTSFTIDHVPKELVLATNSASSTGASEPKSSSKGNNEKSGGPSSQNQHPGLSSAPKDIELWAVLDPVLFPSLDLDNPQTRSLPKPPSSSSKSNRRSSSPPAGILLASHRFDPRETNVQTFPVRVEAAKALEGFGVTPEVVVLRVVRNWGHGEYTCLYRVRVHGS